MNTAWSHWTRMGHKSLRAVTLSAASFYSDKWL